MAIKWIVIFLSGYLLVGCGSSSKNSIKRDQNSLKLDDIHIVVTKKDKEKVIEPVLEYRFDECKKDKRVLDHVGNFDATIINSLNKISSPLNSGVYLNGIDEYIKIPAMGLDYSKGFTFTSWVRFDDDAGSGKNWETIFSFGNDDKNRAYEDKHKTEIWLNRYYKENKLYFAFTNGNRDNPCGDIKTVHDVIKPKEWQFIAVSIDTKNYPHIFVDGKEVEVEVAWHNRGGACKLPFVERDLCYIGKPNDEWMGLDSDGGHRDHKDNNYLHGGIDEVKVFDRFLSSLQLNEIYNREKARKNYDGSNREVLDCSIDKPEQKTKPTTPNISIKIDGNIEDWNKIDGISDAGSELKVYSDEKYLYLMFRSDSVKNPKLIWFIDSDNDQTTGHQAGDWSSSGADFAIGNEGKLYIASTNDDRWMWDSESLDVADEFISKDGIVELKVKKSDFNLAKSFRVGVRVDEGLEDTRAFPAKSMFVFSLEI